MVGLADAKKERDMASPDAVAQIPSFHPSVHTDSSDSEHGGSEHGGDAEQEWLGHGGPEHGGDADQRVRMNSLVIFQRLFACVVGPSKRRLCTGAGIL